MAPLPFRGARVERPWHGAHRCALARNGGREPGVQPLRHPAAPRDQRDGPYFHDHRARTLEDVVKHYQAFFFFINVVRRLPLPQIPDEDIAPIVAYMKKAF
jgi:hypothetical protein